MLRKPKKLISHSEWSEESSLAAVSGFFTSFRMTINLVYQQPVKNKKINIIFCIILINMILIGCQQNITNSSDIVFPDKNISFLHQVYPFLQVTCSYAGCHSAESQAGGIIITDYPSLVQVIGLVIAGKPDNSRLVQLLEGTLPHSSLVYWKVNDNQKHGIRQWILEGAQNN
jgi:hypothetical protein